MKVWERYQSQLESNGEEIPQGGGLGCIVSLSVIDAAFAEDPVTAGELVSTARVGSNGVKAIMLYSKVPFGKPLDAMKAVRASNRRF